MYNNINYEIIYFRSFKDGSITAKAIGDSSVFWIDAEMYREEGEDTLVKARINREYTNALGGESREVFVNLIAQDITLNEIHEAMQEFQYGQS